MSDDAPFRWNIAKREQLGSYVCGDAAPLDAEHLKSVRRACARILALSDGADLAFVGRSPENFFDYLCGAFDGVDGAPALHLVPFSMRWLPGGDVGSVDRAKRDALYASFAAAGVDPAAIAAGARGLALVDLVAYGGTMESLVKLLHDHAARDGVDWNAVQRRLTILGVLSRAKNSPNTWRWQQNQDWLDLIPDATIKNVSAAADFLSRLAGDQPKVTRSFHAGRWGEDQSAAPPTADQRAALNLAVQLYDAGRAKPERAALAALIAAAPEMRQPATRSLVTALKRG